MSTTNTAWTRWLDGGIEVSFGFMFPGCPVGLADLSAGTIRNGMFYPAGSVAASFFRDRQQQQDQETKCQSVYFIQSVHGGPIKIGVASDISSRLDALQTAHAYRLVVLASIPHGGTKLESELHKRFSESRLLGEWFSPTPELLDFINDARSRDTEVL